MGDSNAVAADEERAFTGGGISGQGIGGVIAFAIIVLRM